MKTTSFLTTLQAYPAWERFVKYYDKKKHFKVKQNGLNHLTTIPFENLAPMFQLAALVDWFRVEGYSVSAPEWLGSYWPIVRKIGHPKDLYPLESHKAYYDGLQAAILKAFTLLP